jgi:hypothetical protein
MFKVYPRTEVITLRTRAYTDKDKVHHPATDIDLLLGRELPDGSREAHAVMASNEQYVAVWVSEVKE